jgi:hypothetical protein
MKKPSQPNFFDLLKEKAEPPEAPELPAATSEPVKQKPKTAPRTKTVRQRTPKLKKAPELGPGRFIKIRDFGDNRTIVIHTNDRATGTKLADYSQCLKIVPYEQEQVIRKQHKMVLVGADYYFPKRRLKSLCRNLGIPPQKLLKGEEIQIGNFPPERKNEG